MCEPSLGNPRRPAGNRAAVGKAIEHAAGDAANAESGHIAQSVRPALENCLRGAQPATDGGPDALAEVTRCEPRRIAGDESVVATHHVHAAAQVIAVPGRVVLRAWSKTRIQRRGEVRPVGA